MIIGNEEILINQKTELWVECTWKALARKLTLSLFLVAQNLVLKLGSDDFCWFWLTINFSPFYKKIQAYYLANHCNQDMEEIDAGDA